MAKGIFLMLLWWGLVTVACAQDGQFKPTFSLFPKLSDPILVSDGSNPVVDSTVRALETFKFSASVTIVVSYNLGSRDVLLFGLGYNNLGLTERKTALVFANPEPGAPTHAKTFENYYYAEVPLQYKHYFSNRFYTLAGVSALFNITNSRTIILYYETGNPLAASSPFNSISFRKFNAVPTLGLGYDFFDTDDITLFVQPSAQYTLINLANNTVNNRRIFSFGMMVGLRLN